MEDVEEIKDLPPDERIQRLKKMEEDKKKEIEEAETLIRESMREIGDAEEKKHAPIKQVKAEDISTLATTEEKQVFKTARFQTERQQEEPVQEEQSLEDVAREAQEQEEGKGPLYGEALEKAREGIDYSSRMTTTGQKDDGKGYHSSSQQEEMYKQHTVTEGDRPESLYSREAEDAVSGTYKRRREDVAP